MVEKSNLPHGGGIAVFGLFARASPKEAKAREEDVTLTLKQKERELRELEKVLEDLKAKAAVAAELDQHILKQQDMLNELQQEAERKLREFKRAEEAFEPREARLRAAEQAMQEQQALLDEKRGLLTQKEEALMQREDVVEERKQRAEQLERALARAEGPLEQRRSRIAGLIEKEEARLGVLRQERADSDSILKDHRREAERLENQMRDLAAVGRDLEKARETLARKAVDVASREQAIKARERAVDDNDSKLTTKIAALEEAEQMLAQSHHLKEEAERAVNDNKRAAEEARKLIAENTRALSELRDSERRIDVMQEELQGREKEINAKLAEIDRKEKNVLAREMAWVDHQNALKSTIDELENVKRGMDEDVAARKGELAVLRQEWDSALAALRDEKDFLSSQKTEINQLVKADIAALKDKEQELLGMIKGFNNDQSRLDKEERAILARIRLLEKDQRVLNSTKVGLVEREQKLVAQEKTAKTIIAAAAKAKSLASELPKMRREAGVLKKQVAKLERAAVKFGASRAAVHAARVTRTLQRMRTPEVELEPAAVEAREAPALDVAPEMETAPAHEARSAGRHKGRATATGHDELHSMIENARSAVQSGNVQSALAILDDLESAARRLSEEDRRQLSYEIKDLRTSIKLAML